MEDRKDFGWANSWRDTPEVVKACIEAKHKTTDIDVGPPFKGMKHVVVCQICNYVYLYDSSG